MTPTSKVCLMGPNVASLPNIVGILRTYCGPDADFGVLTPA
jgi:hypothetical protein